MNAYDERIVKIVQNIIRQYDGVFDPTKEVDSKMLAEHIVKSLKRNKLLRRYENIEEHP